MNLKSLVAVMLCICSLFAFAACGKGTNASVASPSPTFSPKASPVTSVSASPSPSPRTSSAPKEIGTTDGYIGNLKTKKFHDQACRSLPDEENRTYFDSRKQAIYWGYKPCGNCNP